ncbi:hypothetical protein CDD80_6802 [Ophiocordyceps camponoti-rufipedis]|uniref:Uncharacterized protein n=1 Tax=Ophiocordyceps camponoti-rufipedis TaxID=2004952 RepID=A0A2C5XRY5_9HYPO|nr:hypothetical protein CDD80_6802 [Ophiocordyceps camponoti-rufipedis]
MIIARLASLEPPFFFHYGVCQYIYETAEQTSLSQTSQNQHRPSPIAHRPSPIAGASRAITNPRAIVIAHVFCFTPSHGFVVSKFSVAVLATDFCQRGQTLGNTWKLGYGRGTCAVVQSAANRM